MSLRIFAEINFLYSDKGHYFIDPESITNKSSHKMNFSERRPNIDYKKFGNYRPIWPLEEIIEKKLEKLL